MKNELQYQMKKIGTVIYRYFINRFGSRDKQLYGITRYSGMSYPFGKKETIDLIVTSYPNREISILDVGPGRGTYNFLLKGIGYNCVHAVEIYRPYIDKFELERKYQKVFHANIVGFQYEHYDLVIMGDVIEHIKVKKAQEVIKYAQNHSDMVIVAVPYKLKQIGSQLDGSGDHKQADLTRQTFMKRYPGFDLLIDNHQLGVFYSKKSP